VRDEVRDKLNLRETERERDGWEKKVGERERSIEISA
jgi:hypothetical protein